MECWSQPSIWQVMFSCAFLLFPKHWSQFCKVKTCVRKLDGGFLNRLGEIGWDQDSSGVFSLAARKIWTHLWKKWTAVRLIKDILIQLNHFKVFENQCSYSKWWQQILMQILSSRCYWYARLFKFHFQHLHIKYFTRVIDKWTHTYLLIALLF